MPNWLALEHADEEERIDDPGEALSDVAASMEDVARTNALFGGIHAVIQGVERLLRGHSPGATVSVLDVATGTADIPIALIRWGSARGIRFRVTAVDNHSGMLALARRRIETYSAGRSNFPGLTRRLRRDIRLVQADARQLPFPPRTFDIATCALALHHMGFDASIDILRAMDRATRRGFVVTDLRRDKPTFWTVKTGIALVGGHPITRHDSLASVRRSFSWEEWNDLAVRSAVSSVSLDSHLYYRLRMIQNKGTSTEL
jgi:ubiquinone/menaquinone biosynthesis C-methylase UbiE